MKLEARFWASYECQVLCSRKHTQQLINGAKVVWRDWVLNGGFITNILPNVSKQQCWVVTRVLAVDLNLEKCRFGMFQINVQQTFLPSDDSSIWQNIGTIYGHQLATKNGHVGKKHLQLNICFRTQWFCYKFWKFITNTTRLWMTHDVLSSGFV